ncbi:MAG: hypothetical protein JWP63_767 [Candidatus Solibacter sp.]|nr:hypothetical protein [Candidatus Solibacter sp.]
MDTLRSRRPAKALGRSAVCPYLINVDAGELPAPLAQFQASQATKSGTLALVQSLNASIASSRLTESRLDESFEAWWPKLDKELVRLAQTMDGTSENGGSGGTKLCVRGNEGFQSATGQDFGAYLRRSIKAAPTASVVKVLGMDCSEVFGDSFGGLGISSKRVRTEQAHRAGPPQNECASVWTGTGLAWPRGSTENRSHGIAILCSLRGAGCSIQSRCMPCANCAERQAARSGIWHPAIRAHSHMVTSISGS